MKNLANICQTCLSSNRRLVSTSEIDYALKEIKFNVELEAKRICWECHQIIIKFYKFILQVRNAEIALGKQLQFQNLKTLSNLLNTSKNTFDLVLIHKDPLNNITVTIEAVKEKIKEEIGDEENPSTPHYDSDDDKKLQVFVDILKNTKEETPTKLKPLSRIKKKKQEIDKKVLKKFEAVSLTAEVLRSEEEKDCKLLTSSRIRNKKEADNSVLKKFKAVLLTKEEVLRSREEKRSHPNFKKVPYKCDMCVLGFTKQENYDLHYEKNHNQAIGEHVCQVCSRRFASKHSLNRHESKHYLNYVCSLCTYKTSALKVAVNHCKDKHALDEIHKIHCKQCEAVFKCPFELAEHTRIAHTLHCNDCGEMFKGKNTLRTHINRIHAVKREFICEMCNKTFLTKSRLESHMTTHGQTVARRLAYCNQCRVQYKNIQVYRSHVRNSVEHSQNRYQCPECNKKFASKVYWTQHYNFYHLKKSNYKCETCNKLFISKWRLKNHKQKYHGLNRPRDHNCNECGKKFYTLTTLRGHLLTHSEQRLYMCSDCGDTFKQRPALYSHERRVHKAIGDNREINGDKRGTNEDNGDKIGINDDNRGIHGTNEGINENNKIVK